LRRIKNNRDRLDLSKNGISGSAVIPNIEIDPQWQSQLNTIIGQFRIHLDAGKKRLSLSQDS